jgi:hypothetical protein
MDNPENTPATISSEMEEMKAQYEDLRQLVVTGLVILFFMSCVFNLFLWRQLKFTSTDLALIQPQANQIINAYVKESPGMLEFVKKVAEYGKAHPDFAPISAKYGLSNYLNKPGSAPATAAPPPGLAPSSQNTKK